MSFRRIRSLSQHLRAKAGYTDVFNAQRVVATHVCVVIRPKVTPLTTGLASELQCFWYFLLSRVCGERL